MLSVQINNRDGKFSNQSTTSSAQIQESLQIMVSNYQLTTEFYNSREIEEMVNELSLDDFQLKIGGGAVLPLLPESDIPALLSVLPESDFPSSPWPRRYSSSLIGSSELDPILIDSDPPVTAALPANSSGATPVVSSTEEAQDLKRKGAANSGDYGKRRRKNVNQNLKAKQEALPGCNSKSHKVGILDCAIECAKSTVQESEKRATQQNIMPQLGINPQHIHILCGATYIIPPPRYMTLPRMVQYPQQVSVYNVPYMPPQVYNHMNGHRLNSHHVMYFQYPSYQQQFPAIGARP